MGPWFWLGCLSPGLLPWFSGNRPSAPPALTLFARAAARVRQHSRHGPALPRKRGTSTNGRTSLYFTSRPGAHTPGRSGRWAASGRQPEPLVRPSRPWTPGGSSVDPPTGVCHRAGQLAVPGHPRDIRIFDAHRLVFTDGSRAELVERVRAWSATVAWATAHLKRTVARLLAPLALGRGLRCGFRIRPGVARRNGGGAIFSPFTVTGDGEGCPARVKVHGVAVGR